MFENDGKKELRKKYNKLKGIVNQKSKFKFGNEETTEQPTIYGELKLSEKLNIELQEQKEEVETLTDALENMTYKRDALI